jgi:hypothetical protein
MLSELVTVFTFVGFAVSTLSAQMKTPASTNLQSPVAIEAQGLSSAAHIPAQEDWTTISLAKSGLPINATNGVLLSKADLPNCNRELVRMQWRPNDPIELYVIRPHPVDTPRSRSFFSITHSTPASFGTIPGAIRLNRPDSPSLASVLRFLGNYSILRDR